MQTELSLERWLNSGRDRLHGLTIKHWTDLVALIVSLGGVRFTEDDMLADLHERVPMSRGIQRLADLDSVTATHWRWDWEMKRPDLLRELERRRAERPQP